MAQPNSLQNCIVGSVPYLDQLGYRYTHQEPIYPLKARKVENGWVVVFNGKESVFTSEAELTKFFMEKLNGNN